MTSGLEHMQQGARAMIRQRPPRDVAARSRSEWSWKVLQVGITVVTTTTLLLAYRAVQQLGREPLVTASVADRMIPCVARGWGRRQSPYELCQLHSAWAT